MNLFQCMFINSPWYKETRNNSKPVAILWHDTAGGNPYLKRYVQPYETDPNYDELMEKLGKNTHGNDWNHSGRRSGVNAFIGKLADGTIATAQVGKWEMCPWGCGSGSKGSLNGYYKDEQGKDEWIGRHAIQFEICDSGYDNYDPDYFKAVYREACEFTAYLCKLYGIDPLGTIVFNGVSVPTILCHKDANNLKLGSAHGDIYVWFEKYGVDMNDVRRDVAALAKGEDPWAQPEATEEFHIGDTVEFKSSASKWANGKTIPGWVKEKELYVRVLKDDGGVSVSTARDGSITGTANPQDLVVVKCVVKEEPIDEPAIVPDEPVVDIPNDDPPVVVPDDNTPDTPTEDDLGTYIKDIGEAQNFLVRLLNLLIDFIIKAFTKKQ